MKWLKKHATFEKLLGGKHKVSIGAATGTAKSESKAMELCEEEAVDILQNARTPTFQVRDGFLIGSGIESSKSAWFFIHSLEDLQGDEILGRMIFPQTFLHPKKLKEAIESQLAQMLADRDGAAKLPPAATLAVGNGATPEVFSLIAGVRKIYSAERLDVPFHPVTEVVFECTFGPDEPFQSQLQKFINVTSPSSPANFKLTLQHFASDNVCYFAAYALSAEVIEEPFCKVTKVTLRVVGKIEMDSIMRKG